MRTLYLRNVPDEVVERLERLAARDATSVGAVAVRELADVSRRADNPALLGALPALAAEQLHAPHLIDVEVAHGLRRRVAAKSMTGAQGRTALDAWRRLGMTRYPTVSLLERVWQLRENLSAYDAAYVALAEALDCPLLTADGRLSRAPGARCSITVVPR